MVLDIIKRHNKNTNIPKLMVDTLINQIDCTTVNVSFPVMCAVFNALVLFCIRDVYVALQRMLNLKPNKDQKKYEVDLISVNVNYFSQLL